jgi:hypothetical protein
MVELRRAVDFAEPAELLSDLVGFELFGGLSFAAGCDPRVNFDSVSFGEPLWMDGPGNGDEPPRTVGRATVLSADGGEDARNCFLVAVPFGRACSFCSCSNMTAARRDVNARLLRLPRLSRQSA